MQNVNLVRNKYAVIYYSIGGNTKQIAKLISEELSHLEQDHDLLALDKKINISTDIYTHVFLGSPTYGEGRTPNQVLDYLRYLLKENDFNLPSFSIFGSGDTQWTTYCRAVDEIDYHLSKRTEVINSLKVEQYPINKQQIEDIKQYVREVTTCYN